MSLPPETGYKHPSGHSHHLAAPRTSDDELASACRFLDDRGARFYFDGPPKDAERFVPALLTHARSLGWRS